jgi:tagatose-6-phosphate ketose/aldose isomerase
MEKQHSEYHCYREIHQQPVLWKNVFDRIDVQRSSLKKFLAVHLREHTEVIFTGAGSSFFIGEMVAGSFQFKTGYHAKAVPSTEIVTHPLHYIPQNGPVLLISFARSGNSPESVAAAALAQEINPNTAHLIITCNADGNLSKAEFLKNKYTLLLGEECNDKALAMTGSVTSMALAALLIADLDRLEKVKTTVNAIAYLAETMVKHYEGEIKKIADRSFERVVFLGSGPFFGTAHEAHLKVQEMTDGQLICKFDSFLGFRHGPKAVVNEKTLMVYFHSNDPYVKKYEDDLVSSINAEQDPAFTLAVCKDCHLKNDYDFVIKHDDFMEIEESYLVLPYLIPIQLFSYYKSHYYGLNPDNPSKRGVIHRVVQGVKIYDYDKSELLK